MIRVGLLGVPLDANSSHLAGCSGGPAAVRELMASGMSNLYAEDGTDLTSVLVDRGDVVIDNEPGSWADHLRIRDSVGSLMDEGLVPLLVGGDHSVTSGAIAAVAERHRPLTIVHLDAHPDLYDDFEGNPLSHASPFARIMEQGHCDRLIQIGIRTATAHQHRQAERFRVEIHEARDLSGWDPGAVSGPTYVSLDLDGLDPAFAPGVSHHEPGGLTSRFVIDLIPALPGPVIGADVVELNPDRDPSGITTALALKLVKELAAALVG